MASVCMVDWLGDGGRDILYTVNPIYMSAGTYLYREIRENRQRIPIYEEAEKLDVLPDLFLMPLVLENDPGFHILSHRVWDLILHRNRGARGRPDFSAEPEVLPVGEVSLKEAMARVVPDFAPATFSHSHDRHRGVTDLIVVAGEPLQEYFPGGRMPRRFHDSPDLGYGRGYDDQGEWLGRKLQFKVLLLKNLGDNEQPVFRDIEVLFEFASYDKRDDACLVDVAGTGERELIIRKDVDRLFRVDLKTKAITELSCSPLQRTYFRSQFCASDVDGDGETEILTAGNPGVVLWLDYQQDRWVEQPPLLRRGGPVRVESLSVPCLADLDDDGDLDLVVGDSSGYLWFFENKTEDPPGFTFKAGRRLTAGVEEIHHVAGPTGSFHGPNEARWGYLNPMLVDWDGDGLLDVITNDNKGEYHWYRNIGSKTGPAFAAPVPLLLDGKTFVGARRSRPTMWNAKTMVALDIDGLVRFYPLDDRDRQVILEGRPLRYHDGCAVRGCGVGYDLGRTTFFACDWDEDGVMDLVIGMPHNSHPWFNAMLGGGGATPLWLKNIGTDDEPVFERARLITLKDGTTIDLKAHKCSPWCVDLDGDGHLDLVSGAEDGKIRVWLRKHLKWDWDPTHEYMDRNYES